MSEQLRRCAEPHLYCMKELSKANRRRAKKLMELAPDKFMSFMTIHAGYTSRKFVTEAHQAEHTAGTTGETTAPYLPYSGSLQTRN